VKLRQLKNTIKMKEFVLNDIKITDSTLSEIYMKFKDFISNPSGSKLILTFNLDFLRNAGLNHEFKEVCLNSDMNLADGAGITSLIYLKYKNKIRRITGSEVFELLLQISNELHLKIALFGGSLSAVNAVKYKSLKLFPNIKDIKAISPPRLFEEDHELNRNLIEELKIFSPNILVAALGNPRQEIWLYKYKDEIGAGINIGVGAVFDFYSGVKKRAPKIFQKSGTEWMWRLASEPRRLFKRYVVNGISFYMIQAAKILTKK
jgi:N-acetylglucosaminyldiphosphoundecaprenol N-acetyl-beta-D-mannosaminyltransferase